MLARPASILQEYGPMMRSGSLAIRRVSADGKRLRQSGGSRDLRFHPCWLPRRRGGKQPGARPARIGLQRCRIGNGNICRGCRAPLCPRACGRGFAGDNRVCENEGDSRRSFEHHFFTCRISHLRTSRPTGSCDRDDVRSPSPARPLERDCSGENAQHPEAGDQLYIHDVILEQDNAMENIKAFVDKQSVAGEISSRTMRKAIFSKNIQPMIGFSTAFFLAQDSRS